MKKMFIYIITNKKKGTLYIGVTNNLVRRIYEHKNKLFKGFSARYNLNILVYFEEHGSTEQAFKREKELKKWKREWKIQLIEKNNPDWNDLYHNII